MQDSKDFLTRLVMAQVPIWSNNEASSYLEFATRSDEKPKNGIQFESIALPKDVDLTDPIKLRQAVDSVINAALTLLTKPHLAYFVGAQVRITARLKHARKLDISDYTCIFALDVDHVAEDELVQRIQKLPLQPNWIVPSGGGFHLYYVVTSPVHKYISEALVKYLSEFVGGDHTQDCTRILRIPGTMNRKYTPPVRVGFKVIREEAYELADMQELIDNAVTHNPIGSEKHSSPVEFSDTQITAEVKVDLFRSLSFRVQNLVRTGEDVKAKYRKDHSRSADIYVAVLEMSRLSWTPDQMWAVLSDPANTSYVKVADVESKQGPGAAKRYLARTIANARKFLAANFDGKFNRNMDSLTRLLDLVNRILQNQPLLQRVFRSRITLQFVEVGLSRLMGQLYGFYERLNDLPKETLENRDEVIAARKRTLHQIRDVENAIKSLFAFVPLAKIYRQIQNLPDDSELKGKKLFLDLLDWKYENAWYEHAPLKMKDVAQAEILALYDDFGAVLRIHSLRRQQCTAQLAYRYFSANGEFLYTPTGANDFNRPFPASTVFYRDGQNRVIILNSEDFDKLLETTLYLVSKKDRALAVNYTAGKYRSFKKAQVGFLSRYNSETHAVYMDKGEGNLLKVTPHSVSVVPNGTDNVFLRTMVEPWDYVAGNQGHFIDLLTKVSVDAASSQLTPEQTRYAIKTWIVANFLRGLVNHYTLLTLVGEKGSGKTSLAENIVRFILGNPEYTAEQTPRESRDFVTTCVHKGIFVLDNVEEMPKWDFKDYLARLFNRGTISQRNLYSDADLFEFKTDSFLILTCMEPAFARDDVADRSLVVPVKSWFQSFDDGDSSQAEHLHSIMNHRNEIYTEIVNGISRVLRLLQDKPLSKFRIAHRLESYAMVVNAWAEANHESVDIEEFWENFRGQQSNITIDMGGIAEFLAEYLENVHQELASGWAVKHPGEPYPFELELTPTALHRKLSEFHNAAYFTQVKGPGVLTKRLNAGEAALKAAGIEVSSRKLHGVNHWKINYREWAASHLGVAVDATAGR